MFCGLGCCTCLVLCQVPVPACLRHTRFTQSGSDGAANYVRIGTLSDLWREARNIGVAADSF